MDDPIHLSRSASRQALRSMPESAKKVCVDWELVFHETHDLLRMVSDISAVFR